MSFWRNKQQTTNNKQQTTNNKQQTTNNKHTLLSLSAVAFLSLCPLSAEDNGMYVQGGFQYSNFSGQHILNNTSYTFAPASGRSCESYRGAGYLPGSTTTCRWNGSVGVNTYNGNLYGADIQFGYKQFFGNSKHFGLRYYGIFSGQGGRASSIAYVAGDYNIFNQPSANLFYGVGMDALFNFYERNHRTFGMFVGFMIGGSTWLMGKSTSPDNCQWTTTTETATEVKTACATMNESFKNEADRINNPFTPPGATPKEKTGKATFSPTAFQFIFNVGLRTNFTKHQGFEFGVRIPTIDDPYFTIKNTKGEGNGRLDGGIDSSEKVIFRRNVALYWNYAYNF
ncbi:outer membrane protein [Helicobacter felis]|uniref:outer membrane protein n=2 Tax=Helicobacter felis TaxID=214 RepID=UPI000CF07889|nr:outer membrane protein [Helicobacter felis]